MSFPASLTNFNILKLNVSLFVRISEIFLRGGVRWRRCQHVPTQVNAERSTRISGTPQLVVPLNSRSTPSSSPLFVVIYAIILMGFIAFDMLLTIESREDVGQYKRAACHNLGS